MKIGTVGYMVVDTKSKLHKKPNYQISAKEVQD